MTQKTKKNCHDPVNGRFTTTCKRNERLILSIKIKGFKTISACASKCGFSRGFISAVIYYHTKPTIAQAQKICSVLGLSISDIFYPSEIRNWDIFKPSNELNHKRATAPDDQ